VRARGSEARARALALRWALAGDAKPEAQMHIERQMLELDLGPIC
jgi:hypothetical protein